MSVELDTGKTDLTKQLDFQAIAKSLGMDTEDMQAVMKELAPILSASLNLTITQNDGTITVQRNAPIAVDAPELDAEDAIVRTVDLEALIAYLQIENDENQLEVAKTRIEALKGGIEADHLSTQQSIEKSIEESKEAEEAAQRQKRLGIIGAIVGVVATVVIGIVTGGVAIAAISLAVMATMTVLNKTGANEAIANGISELLQKCNVEKDVADKIGKFIVGAAEMVAALVVMLKSPAMVKKLGGKIAAKIAGKTAGKAAGTATGKAALETAEKTAGKAAGKAAGKTSKGSGEKSSSKNGTEDINKQEPTQENKSTEMDELDADGKKIEKSDAEKPDAEKPDAEKPDADDPDFDAEQAKRDTAERNQKYGQIANSTVMGGTAVVNTTASVVSGVRLEDAEEAAADVKEAQAYLKEFQSRLEEEQDALMAILQLMNENMAALADILESQSKANAAITSHIGG